MGLKANKVKESPMFIRGLRLESRAPSSAPASVLPIQSYRIYSSRKLNRKSARRLRRSARGLLLIPVTELHGCTFVRLTFPVL